MPSWLRKKAAQQSLVNVEINTRTLIVVSNRADEAVVRTKAVDPANTREVVKAQTALLTDMQLAVTNGATLEEIRSKIDAARAGTIPSSGAELAIAHAWSYLQRSS